MDEFEPVSCGGDMDHAHEAVGELILLCGNGTMDLQTVEHMFDAVALLVEPPVMADLHPPV